MRVSRAFQDTMNRLLRCLTKVQKHCFHRIPQFFQCSHIYQKDKRSVLGDLCFMTQFWSLEITSNFSNAFQTPLKINSNFIHHLFSTWQLKIDETGSWLSRNSERSSSTPSKEKEEQFCMTCTLKHQWVICVCVCV